MIQTANITGQGSMVSKKSGLGYSRGPTTSSTPPHKSSSLVSLFASKDSVDSCSSGDRSADASSSKSFSNFLRRKTCSRYSKLSPGSTFSTPLTQSVRTKSGLKNSTSSITSSSMTNHSYTISPASSFDGWSLESSSSASAAKQGPHNLDASLDSTLTGVSVGTDATQAKDLQSPSPDLFSVFQEIQETSLPSQCPHKTFRATTPVPLASSENFIPSGLQMPSPKMGFFDEVSFSSLW
ncbi:unnamed protein product [Ilex paraguariensis]|uniref:Uncharacterized protein n=1 Tax=Ilex paraguariensis TaxID=185542 RepID=A0ABC8SE50_9AQUA